MLPTPPETIAGDALGSGQRRPQRLLRLRDVCRTTGLCRSMIYKMQAENRFPQRVRIGLRNDCRDHCPRSGTCLGTVIFRAPASICAWTSTLCVTWRSKCTQGRVMDPIKQGTLKLATLKHIVLEVISCLSA